MGILDTKEYTPLSQVTTFTFTPDIYASQLGEKGSGFRQRVREAQDFSKLRDELVSKGQLFEDPDFPAASSSLYYSQTPARSFEWKRPKEIVQNPEFVVEGASRFDIMQGELGDCWLLAAVANLTLNEYLFTQVVPLDQGFSEKDKYAGIFHFRFWQYGRWVDVVIDDRLPTINGKLVFMHSSQANEFWSALFEKAFAKLHGSYEALKGGGTSEAMEDFTGGVAEVIELKDPPPNLFQFTLKCFDRLSLMACAIEATPGELEAQTPEGLVKGHAYSITKVQNVDIETPGKTGKMSLVRLRNPWGNETEWNGAWSDKSPEWKFIPESQKKALGLTFDADGEFWMSFRDFTQRFDRLEICLINPDTVPELAARAKKRWEMSVFEGEWARGVTAGGCRNYLETFHRNPQYRITLVDPDEDDEEEKCTVIVALMQKNRRVLRKIGAECLTIGFAIYELEDPDSLPKPLDLNYFRTHASTARCPSFVNLREITCRFQLPPGMYCIVPSTFEPNQEGEFILRVFSERKNNMEEIDTEVEIIDKDIRIATPSEPDPVSEKKDEKTRELFKKLAGDDLEVDWMELKEILDYAMRNDVPSSNSDSDNFIQTILSCFCTTFCRDTALASAFETQYQGFSKDVCRSMIAMMDVDRSGKLGFEEFQKLWLDVRDWKTVFKLYDKDNTGYLSAFGLKDALQSAGYHLNNHILNVLSHRYASKDGKIAFDDFMMCAVRLKSMIEIFKERAADGGKDKNSTAEFTMEEWIETTLYS